MIASRSPASSRRTAHAPSEPELRLTAMAACAGCAAKVAPGDLRQALGGLDAPRRDKRVLVDYRTLDDAGVFAYRRDEMWVQTVDFFTPILDDPYDFGRVAATNALSDVYAMGGHPLTALSLLCLPDGFPPAALRELLRGGQHAISEAGASILGGHSVRDPELKFGYSVTGIVKRKHLLTNAGARPGDRLVLTKPLGTGILSTALKQQRLDAPTLRRLTRSMTTLNRHASEAAVEFGARAATDVTGFSLLGHASQMADASDVTIRMQPAASWFLPRTLELAKSGATSGGLAKNRAFFASRVDAGPVEGAVLDALFDPQTSGGLLIAIPQRRAPRLLAALKRRRVWSVVVGEVVARGRVAIELHRGP